MALSEQEALSLREGDVVLVPMLVRSTNNHYDKGVGVTLSCMIPTTTGVRELPTNEFRSGKEYVSNIVSTFVQAIHKKSIREGDWVSVERCGPGKVKSLIGDEAVVRLRRVLPGDPKHGVFRLAELERTSMPDDMTDAEKKEFTRAG